MVEKARVEAVAGRRDRRVGRLAVAALIVAAAWSGLVPEALAGDELPPGRFAFRTYGAGEGLTNLAIEGIAQEPMGLLWVATQDGLYRFDGYEFTRFGVGDGLPSVWTAFVQVDRSARLWVGTAKGLAVRRGDRFVAADPATLPRERVWDLAATPDGGVVVSFESGLFRASAVGGFERLRGWPWGKASAVAADPRTEGVIYAAHGATIGRFEDGRWSFADVGLEAGGAIDAMAIDGHGVLWISSPRGLWLRRPGEDLFEEETAHVDRRTNALSHSFLAIDRQGELWVPTDSGLSYRRDGRWRVLGEAQGLPGGWAQGLFHDRHGSLWVWQSGVGLYRMVGLGLWESWTRQEGLPGDIVWSVLRDRAGQLWVGTSDGLSRPLAGRWQTVSGTEGLAVRQIVEAPDGTLWLAGAPARVLHLDPRTGALHRYGDAEGLGDAKQIDLEVDHRGGVWLGTRAGLLHKPPAAEVFAPRSGPRETLIVHEDSRGRMWIGGRGDHFGLAVLDEGRWHRYTTADGLLADDVLLLTETPAGDFWLAYTEPLGLTRLRLEGHRLSIVEHVPADSLSAVGTTYFLGLDPQGRLWRGTGGGIDVLGAGHRRHFDSTDGLVADDCSFQAFWADPGGDVFLGTSGGLSRFRGGEQTAPEAPPHTLILAATLADRSLSGDPHEVVVPREQNTLSVRFAALSFVQARRVSYQVRLLGLESGWFDSRTRQARYAALPSGSYRFEVRARVAEDAWGPPARLSFRILPAWWESWWARSLAVLSVLALIAAVFRFRLRRLEQQRARLAALVEERTVELSEANRRLQHLSASDGLTGLANRRAFDERLDAAWRRARRDGSELALLLVDIDGFKLFNDLLGHLAGDDCLRRIAAVLGGAGRRPDDLAARYGGEEFALILPGAGEAVAREIGERLRRRVQELAIPHPGPSAGGSVTVSIGVACGRPSEEASAWDLVGAADAALYRAKSEGRNRLVVAGLSSAAA